MSPSESSCVAPVSLQQLQRQRGERRAAAALELEVVQDGAHQAQAPHRAAVVDRARDRLRAARPASVQRRQISNVRGVMCEK